MAHGKIRVALILAVLVLGAYVLFYHLGSSSLVGDEAAHAVVSRCILEQGRLYPLCTKSVVTNKVLIYCGGKEPLKFWLEALLFKVASVSELTARIIDASLGMATILLILFVGGALLGWETGVLAALMVLAFPPIILSHCFRAGTQDSLLVFSYTGAVMGYLWYRTKGSRVSLCLATLAVIAGLMTKDVFLLSVYPSVAVAEAILFSRRKGSQGILPMGFLFFLLVPLVWYFLWLLFAYFSTHGACIKHLIKREFVKPALGKVASWSTHYRGPFFYLKILLKFLGPILFFPVLFFVFSRSRDESTENTKRAAFLLIVSLVYLILISIPAFKMKRYVYPIYPTLSLGLAFFVIGTIKMIPSKILKALVASGVGALLAMNLFYISSKITTKTREVPSCKFVKHFQALKGPKVFIIERSSGISMGSHNNFYLSLIPHIKRMPKDMIKKKLEEGAFKGTVAIAASHPNFYEGIPGVRTVRVWDMRKRKKSKVKFSILEVKVISPSSPAPKAPLPNHPKPHSKKEQQID